jgi:archaellin
MNIFLKKIIEILRRISKEQRGIATIPTVLGVVSALAVAGTLANAVVYQGADVSQEAEQVVQETLQNIQGTYQLRGCPIGTAATTGPNGTIGQIIFTLALVSRGGYIDFTPPTPTADNTGLADPASNNIISISYTDKYQHAENLYWTIDTCGKNNGDNLLEYNELFQLTIGGSPVPGQNGGNMVDALGKDLSTDTTFNIEMKAPQGTTLRLERRTPPNIDTIVNFHY